MEAKIDVYPFHFDFMSAENLVRHLEPALEEQKILRVCYPALTGDYRKTEELEANLKKAQSLIDSCLLHLSVVPPVVLKDIDNFWYGVNCVWIPWTFREFAAGRLPLSDGRFSRELDKKLVNFVMLTPLRVIYPFASYFKNEDKARTEEIKQMFNTILY